MTSTKTIIFLSAPGRRRGIPMAECDYVVVRDFILETLQKEKGMLMTNLIDAAHAALSSRSIGDLGWFVLHVKQDLEVKGLIRKAAGFPHQQFLFVKPNRRKLSAATSYL